MEERRESAGLTATLSSALSSATETVSSVLPALSGCVDVVVVRQPDGALACTPFHVRFGKYQGLVAPPKDLEVRVRVNGALQPWTMALGRRGDAYFGREAGAGGGATPCTPPGAPPAGGLEEEEEAEGRGIDSGYSSPDDAEIAALGRVPYATAQDAVAIAEEAAAAAANASATPSSSWFSFRRAFSRKKGDNGEEAARSPAPGPASPQPAPLHRTVSSPPALMIPSPPRDGYLADHDGPRPRAVRRLSRGWDPPQPMIPESPTAEPGDGCVVVSIEEQPTVRVRLHASSASPGPASPLVGGGGGGETRGRKAGMLQLSLCGHELQQAPDAAAKAEAFDRHFVSADTFAADPVGITNNERLVCRVDGVLYPWSAAAPVMLSLLAFGRPLGSGRAGEGGDPPDDNGGVTQAERSRDVQQHSQSRRRRKVLKPTQEQLLGMGLKPGKNHIEFALESAAWGRQVVEARVFLWEWNSRVVVSDVDGTVTRSDVMGHLMPLVGKDWSHSGVAVLYNNIVKNDYKLMFLSSRAVGLSDRTRAYLAQVEQDGVALADGPVVVAPDSITSALYREVVRRAPQEFKMKALQEIRDLFPEGWNPFYAGFGNRNTDEISYASVGVPPGRIFTINPKGEVVCPASKLTRTHTLATINDLVNEFFPPVGLEGADDEYASFSYWRQSASAAWALDDADLEVLEA